MGRLTVAGVRAAKPGRHSDGDGLYLYVKPGGARSWLLRVQADGRRRDIGLGSVEVVTRAGTDLIDIPLLHRKTLTLAEARDKCALLRKAAQAGLDPVAERDKDRRGIPTFEQATEAAFEALKSKWKPRQQEAFMSSMRRHAFPLLGARRIAQVDAAAIIDVLKPLMADKIDMGRKVGQRIGLVLNFSHAKGWRSSEMPRAAVAAGLPKGLKGGNYAAMPYAQVPAFVAKLRAKPATVGRLALLFTILTAARSGEVRHARWSQIDAERKLWRRPGTMMKTSKPHEVTLSDAALAILHKAEPLRADDTNDLIFPNSKGKPLSDATLSKILRDEGQPFTVHGFRSSFRDWAAEQMPEIPDPVAEAALAHAVPDKVVAAYKRTHFVDMRRGLLEAWCIYVKPKEGPQSEIVKWLSLKILPIGKCFKRIAKDYLSEQHAKRFLLQFLRNGSLTSRGVPAGLNIGWQYAKGGEPEIIPQHFWARVDWGGSSTAISWASGFFEASYIMGHMPKGVTRPNHTYRNVEVTGTLLKACSTLRTSFRRYFATSMLSMRLMISALLEHGQAGRYRPCRSRTISA